MAGKTYKGEDIRIEPPETGWGEVWFSDGYKAQIGNAKIVEDVKGREMIDFNLMPYEDTAKKYKIDIHKDLDRDRYVWISYPIEMVKLLNTFDPSRRAVFFCLLGWDRKPTESTKWFLGKTQIEDVERLKSIVRNLKIDMSVLKQENRMLKEDTEEYIKKNIDKLIKPLTPLMRGIIMSESKGGE